MLLLFVFASSLFFILFHKPKMNKPHFPRYHPHTLMWGVIFDEGKYLYIYVPSKPLEPGHVEIIIYFRSFSNTDA